MRTEQRKALLPVAKNLSDVFEEFQWCRFIVTPKNGSYTESPEGFFFVGWKGHCIQDRDGETYFLYGRPKTEVLERIKPHIINGEIESFEVIPWERENRALIIARPPPRYIGDAWVCFIEPIPEPLQIRR